MKSITFLSLALTSSLVACSGDDGGTGNEGVDCDNETRADTYTAGMSKLGDNSIEFVLVEATPTPPAKGDNDWTVQVLDAAAPMDGLTLDITPFMPDHGHGTPVIAEATATGESGTYEVTPVNLWMPGLWQVSISASDDSGMLDTAVFAFCIDG